MSDPEQQSVRRYGTHTHQRATTVYDAVARRFANRNGALSTAPEATTSGDYLPTIGAAKLTDKALIYQHDKARPLTENSARQVKPPKLDLEALAALYSYTLDLPPEVEQPDSELLEALHAYVSDFCASRPGYEALLGALDGTALVAMGILMEEVAREALGSQGDLALTEPHRYSRITMSKELDGLPEALGQIRTHLPDYEPTEGSTEG